MKQYTAKATKQLARSGGSLRGPARPLQVTANADAIATLGGSNIIAGELDR
ncbi:MAG: hypothetical protein KGR26_08870 [Cyanobacteria bacterium REEB65]|nr:hypothetical protein [Cyanobacteria bacterium REEB65]